MSDDLDSIPATSHKSKNFSRSFKMCNMQKKHAKKAISQAASKNIRSIVDAAVLRKDDVHRLLSEEFKDLSTLSKSTGLIHHRLYFKSYVSKSNVSFAKLEYENKNRGKGEQKKP